MIVLAVVAIIVAIAYPSYMGYVRKSRRQAAMTALYQVQLAEESYRAKHPTYGTLADLGMSVTTDGGYYTLKVKLPDPPEDQVSYLATATAVAGTSQADDKAGGVRCTPLTVSQNKPVFDPAGQKACWGH